MDSVTLGCFFFFNDTATTEIYTLSLHDALPIFPRPGLRRERADGLSLGAQALVDRSEEHTSELQSRLHLVCRLLLEKKKIHHHSVYLSICNYYIFATDVSLIVLFLYNLYFHCWY